MMGREGENGSGSDGEKQSDSETQFAHVNHAD
jgi:hypothetical protein